MVVATEGTPPLPCVSSKRRGGGGGVSTERAPP